MTIKTYAQDIIDSARDNMRDFWPILLGMVAAARAAQGYSLLHMFLTSLSLWFLVAAWARVDRNIAIQDVRNEYLDKEREKADKLMEEIRAKS